MTGKEWFNTQRRAKHLSPKSGRSSALLCDSSLGFRHSFVPGYFFIRHSMARRKMVTPMPGGLKEVPFRPAPLPSNPQPTHSNIFPNNKFMPVVLTLLCSRFMKKPAGKTPAGLSNSSVQLFSAGTACLINTLYSDEFGTMGALHVDELVGSIRGAIGKVGHGEGIHSVIGMRNLFPCSVDQIRGACGVI
jgi:hypothetical protein